MKPRWTALLLLLPGTAWAGMPFITLSDLATLRLQAISFFGVIFVGAWLLVHTLWNSLASAAPSLPRLSRRAALGLVGLWSLVFYLVLTMISGAREIMTPGAWTRDGALYALTEPERVAKRDEAARQERLERLRAALWRWAEGHGGRFPETGWEVGFEVEALQSGDPSGLRYIYRGGLVSDRGRWPLAWEPGVFGARRFVLFTDGGVEELGLEELQALAEATP